MSYEILVFITSSHEIFSGFKICHFKKIIQILNLQLDHMKQDETQHVILEHDFRKNYEKESSDLELV
jgi:hypothetical protein